MSGATVNIPLNDLDDMRTQIKTLESEIIKYKKQRDDAIGKDQAGRIPGLVEAILLATPVVQYAVANLEPLTHKNWPYEELYRFGETLEVLPEADLKEREFGMIIKSFALEIGKIEKSRKDGSLIITEDKTAAALKRKAESSKK